MRYGEGRFAVRTPLDERPHPHPPQRPGLRAGAAQEQALRRLDAGAADGLYRGAGRYRSVKAAAHAVNMSPEGAYQLRRQPGAEEFAAAWNAALDHGIRRLEDIAMERAIHRYGQSPSIGRSRKA